MSIILSLLLIALLVMAIAPVQPKPKDKGGTKTKHSRHPLRRAVFPFLMAMALLFRPRNVTALANDNSTVGTHEGVVSRRADGAYGRYLLLKPGSDPNHVALCGANDRPMGSSEDNESAAAEDLLDVQLLGLEEDTIILTAAAALNANDLLYTANGGLVQTLPVAAGTYYLVGRSLTTVAGTATDNQIEVQHCFPVATVVP